MSMVMTLASLYFCIYYLKKKTKNYKSILKVGGDRNVNISSYQYILVGHIERWEFSLSFVLLRFVKNKYNKTTVPHREGPINA